jgi:hypothetical protein
MTPLPSRLSRRQRLIAGVGILIALLLVVLPFWGKRTGRQRGGAGRLGLEINIEKGKASKELASNAVYGEVITVHLRGTRRGRITVKSLHTGVIYTFYGGWRTSYHPHRYPFIGERVKIYYVSDKGSLEATQVVTEQ